MAAFTVIDHTELGAAASSWDVTSIPTDGTYDHLLVKVSARSDSSDTYGGEVRVTLNGDTGSNYSGTILYAYRSTPLSTRASSAAYMNYSYVSDASQAANTFGSATYWIPHYSNTANFKQMISSSAAEDTSTTDQDWIVAVEAGLWQDTSAVDQITLTAGAADDFVQYSTFTLYGVTGA